MKRLLYILLLTMIVMAGSLVSAQEEDAEELPTIADLVVASTEADEPEFTTLLTAIGLADPAILEVLQAPEGEWTVFAPTDAAFEALAEELGEEDFSAVLEDTDLLTDILLYHVLQGVYFSEDVVGLLEEFDGELDAQTLNGQFLYIEGNLEDGITIDDANLVLEMVDIEASNGVIHVIDAVLLPETRTIADIVVESAEDEEDPEFSTLLTAVNLADESILETLADPEAQLTVFAPTDAAFDALAETLGEETFNAILDDPEALTNILLYHVIDGIVYGDDLTEILEFYDNEFEGPMLNGDTVLLTADDEGTYINDAEIIMTDVIAANGVIHVIDAVLVPPTPEEADAEEETTEEE